MRRNRSTGLALVPLLVAALGGTGGCVDVVPVARYPWLEEPSLELAHETLTIEVELFGFTE